MEAYKSKKSSTQYNKELGEYKIKLKEFNSINHSKKIYDGEIKGLGERNWGGKRSFTEKLTKKLKDYEIIKGLPQKPTPPSEHIVFSGRCGYGLTHRNIGGYGSEFPREKTDKLDEDPVTIKIPDGFIIYTPYFKNKHPEFAGKRSGLTECAEIEVKAKSQEKIAELEELILRK